MKAIEILKVGSKIIEILHNSCIRTNDVKYVPLYDEHEAMVGRGEKKSYVVAYLSEPDTGYTYTDYDGRFTLAFVARGSSPEQFYDTVQHEQKHIVEHIGTYFGVDPKSEESAYLQGEVGRMLFPSVAAIICPGYFIR